MSEPQEPVLETPSPQAAVAVEPTTPEKPEITIEDFVKLDLRVGQVLSCELVPKSKKLLKMEVDLGSEKRQILAGLSQFITCEEMTGRRVVVVANLKPAKLMGLESHGMILATDPGEGGKPVPVMVPAETPLGSKVR